MKKNEIKKLKLKKESVINLSNAGMNDLKGGVWASNKCADPGQSGDLNYDCLATGPYC